MVLKSCLKSLLNLQTLTIPEPVQQSKWQQPVRCASVRRPNGPCRWDPFIEPVPVWLCLFPSRALEHFSIAQVNCQEFQPGISTLYSAAVLRVTDSWISGSLNTIPFLLQPWHTELRCQQWMSVIKELIFGLTTLISVWKGALARRLHSRLQPESVNRERQLQSFEKPLIKNRMGMRSYWHQEGKMWFMEREWKRLCFQ